MLGRLQKLEPARKVRTSVQAGLVADADAQQLRVVLDNLLANAWKFTSKLAEAKIEVFGGDDFSFAVRDNGVGFNPDEAPLFQPFRRFSTAAGFEGAGVGLATVRRIVGRHGGKVWASSHPGAGATFFVSLPQTDPVLLEPAATSASPAPLPRPDSHVARA